MNRIARIARIPFAAVLIALCAAFSSGCVSPDELSGPAPDRGRSELPWNTPQGWESSGVLGGFADRIGTR